MARRALGLLVVCLLVQVIGITALLQDAPCADHCPLDTSDGGCPPLCLTCAPLAHALPAEPTDRAMPCLVVTACFATIGNTPVASAFTRDILHVPKSITV